MQRFKKILSAKSFYGSILFAIALWGYSSLNSEFITNVELPLTIKLPPNRAIENALPTSVSIEVKGSGWHLFNLLYLNSSKSCSIDLSKASFTNDVYVISRTEILKGLQFLLNVEPREVLTDVFDVVTGLVGTYKVPVVPNLKMYAQEGMVIVGEIVCTPDSIRIRGNDRIVKNIPLWYTQRLEFPHVHKSFTSSVPLSDTLAGKVELSQSYITIGVEVQQTAELSFDDVPIIVRGGSEPQNHILSPTFVRITVQGGAEQLEAITSEDISVDIDFNRIINDSTGVIIPDVRVPSGFKLLRIEPPFIYHFVRTKEVQPISLSETHQAKTKQK